MPCDLLVWKVACHRRRQNVKTKQSNLDGQKGVPSNDILEGVYVRVGIFGLSFLNVAQLSPRAAFFTPRRVANIVCSENIRSDAFFLFLFPNFPKYHILLEQGRIKEVRNDNDVNFRVIGTCVYP